MNAGPNTAARIVDLIAALQEVVDANGDDATFAIAHQPGYPLRLDVVGIAVTADIVDDLTRDEVESGAIDGPDDADGERILGEMPTAWIVTDQPNAYDVNPYTNAALWGVATSIDDRA